MTPSRFRFLLAISLVLSVITIILSFWTDSKIPFEVKAQIDLLYEKQALWKMSIAIVAMLLSLGNLCITRLQASQCLNEREVRSPLTLKKPAKRGLLAF